MKTDYDYFFKFVLIGDTCTGKSCLLVRFAVSILQSIFQPHISHVINVYAYRMMTSKKTMLQPSVLTSDFEHYRLIKVQSDSKSGTQQDKKDIEP